MERRIISHMAAVAFLFLLFSSCSIENNNENEKEIVNKYFPLKTGNWWVLKSSNDSLLRKVEGKEKINDNVYYKISETIIHNNKKSKKTVGFYRLINSITVAKYIQEYNNEGFKPAELGLRKLAGTDWIWYRFANNEFLAYEAYSNAIENNDGSVMRYNINRIPKNEEIFIKNQNHKIYCGFNISAANSSSDNSTELFVENIGLVIRTSGSHGVKEGDYYLFDYHIVK